MYGYEYQNHLVFFAGPSADKLVEAKQRTTEPYGSPPDLKTQDIKIMLTPQWQDNGQLFVRQTDPLPLTIVGLTLEVAMGGQCDRKQISYGYTKK